ncbi:MAG: TA system VapC family ribonuclease toxin [Stenotrophobium sp.]
MRCIADANVLLPLLSSDHPHHAPALAWWDEQGDGEVGLCLPVRMGLLRLLSNRKVMGESVQRPEAAWSAVEALAIQPCVVTIDSVPAGHALNWRRNVAGREPTPDLWTDAWLAALAQSLDSEMVTFDRGFRQFKALKLRLLAPETARS